MMGLWGHCCAKDMHLVWRPATCMRDFMIKSATFLLCLQCGVVYVAAARKQLTECQACALQGCMPAPNR